jgi:hypothetical protein
VLGRGRGSCPGLTISLPSLPELDIWFGSSWCLLQGILNSGSVCSLIGVSITLSCSDLLLQSRTSCVTLAPLKQTKKKAYLFMFYIVKKNGLTLTGCDFTSCVLITSTFATLACSAMHVKKTMTFWPPCMILFFHEPLRRQTDSCCPDYCEAVSSIYVHWFNIPQILIDITNTVVHLSFVAHHRQLQHILCVQHPQTAGANSRKCHKVCAYSATFSMHLI